MVLNTRISLRRLLVPALALTTLLQACGHDTKNTGGKSASNKDSAQAVQQGRQVAVNGLGLPVLDALFFEDDFEAELKTKLALSDEQIKKLKTAAHASVADLDEQEGDNYLGSSRTAAKRSDEQIRAIVGDDKAAQLYQLVGQRYAGGDIQGLLPAEPNSIPKDTRIVVNAPAYRMDLWQDGRLLKTYKVGIGYPEFPLPAGMRRAETIIFNPTWTPPDEPWVRGKVEAGKKVAAGSKLNPLGPIKIPIGLPNLIHGGKAEAKLGTFASHGCVGLTNPQVQRFAEDLARLGGSNLTPDEVAGYEAKPTQTKNYKLQKAVPVELRYETVVGEPGGLRVFRDVYERGSNTIPEAEKVLAVYGLKFEALQPAEQDALRAALDEMNRDAKGELIADDGSATNPEKSAKAKTGGTTRDVVGRKEVFVPVAAMQRKGYPAPTGLDSGNATPAGPATPATAARAQ
jgi:lipoprotein-anchoring transpeptidase ErfK/SrfK